MCHFYLISNEFQSIIKHFSHSFDPYSPAKESQWSESEQLSSFLQKIPSFISFFPSPLTNIVYCILFIVFQAAFSSLRSRPDESFILRPSKTCDCVLEWNGGMTIWTREKKKSSNPRVYFGHFLWKQFHSFLSSTIKKKKEKEKLFFNLRGCWTEILIECSLKFHERALKYNAFPPLQMKS